MKARWFPVVVCVLACFLLSSAPPVLAQEGDQQIKAFQLVFLIEGPEAYDIEEHRSARLDDAENFYMNQLVNDQAALIGGAIERGGELKHVLVMDVGSIEFARQIFAEQPSIRMGKLEMEVYPWWAVNGILRKPDDPHDKEDRYLGLLKRPSDAPKLTEEELREIQEGHQENWANFQAAGDLVLAGPVEGGDDLLRIMIFRTLDTDRINDFVAQDPAIQANWLELELYRWNVAKNTFPELPAAR